MTIQVIVDYGPEVTVTNYSASYQPPDSMWGRSLIRRYRVSGNTKGELQQSYSYLMYLLKAQAVAHHRLTPRFSDSFRERGERWWREFTGEAAPLAASVEDESPLLIMQ